MAPKQRLDLYNRVPMNPWDRNLAGSMLFLSFLPWIFLAVFFAGRWADSMTSSSAMGFWHPLASVLFTAAGLLGCALFLEAIAAAIISLRFCLARYNESDMTYSRREFLLPIALFWSGFTVTLISFAILSGNYLYW